MRGGKCAVGERYSMLTIVAPSGKTQWNELLWLCRCDCGGEAVVQGKRLRAGSTRSCGCLINSGDHGVTHGGRYTRLYRTWRGMISRCHNQSDKDFRRYGANGIEVCQEWREDFATFRAWARSAGYADDLLIDRINPALGYGPHNCRWLTPQDSARHTRAVKLSPGAAREIRQLNLTGLSHRRISEMFGVSRSTVSMVCEGKLWAEAS